MQRSIAPQVVEKTSPASIETIAERALAIAAQSHLRVATAECCTGGQIASLLTGSAASRSVFDRAFVAFSPQSLGDITGLSPAEIALAGEASDVVAMAMARKVLRNSSADIALAIASAPGPAPFGEGNLHVHIASLDRAGHRLHREFHFRIAASSEGRDMTARAAVLLLQEAIEESKKRRF